MTSLIEILLKLLEHHEVPFKSKTFPRNQFLKDPNTVDTNLYYIELGSVRAYIIDEDQEHTIRLGYQGNFIAAVDSFITEKSSQLAIQAIKKTKVRVYSKQD